MIKSDRDRRLQIDIDQKERRSCGHFFSMPAADPIDTSTEPLVSKEIPADVPAEPLVSKEVPQAVAVEEKVLVKEPAKEPVKEGPKGPSMMQKVTTLLKENVFLQHILLVPLVILLTYFIGGIIIWPIFLAASVFLSVKSIRKRKQDVYEAFVASLEEDNIDDVQEVAWLNQIVTKYWISCVPALVKPHIDGVSKTLTDSKPAFIVCLYLSSSHVFIYSFSTNWK